MSAIHKGYGCVGDQDQDPHQHRAGKGSRNQRHQDTNQQEGDTQQEDHAAPGESVASVSDTSQ